jgi:hypothetical protein
VSHKPGGVWDPEEDAEEFTPAIVTYDNCDWCARPVLRPPHTTCCIMHERLHAYAGHLLQLSKGPHNPQLLAREWRRLEKLYDGDEDRAPTLRAEATDGGAMTSRSATIVGPTASRLTEG